jgi:hypothetical protein
VTATTFFGICAVVVLGYYVLACWWFPLANCWCCKGSGKHRSKSGKTFRRCRTCSGSGSWFRVGRRLWDWFRGVGS